LPFLEVELRLLRCPVRNLVTVKTNFSLQSNSRQFFIYVLNEPPSLMTNYKYKIRIVQGVYVNKPRRAKPGKLGGRKGKKKRAGNILITSL
jgi:hypothetical protein